MQSKIYLQLSYLLPLHGSHMSVGTSPWWRHQIEPFSALLALCAGNSPVTGEFPAQRPVTLNFDVVFGLRLNKRLSKQSRSCCFVKPSRPVWRHCNAKLTLLNGQYQSYKSNEIILFGIFINTKHGDCTISQHYEDTYSLKYSIYWNWHHISQ